jgi:hypothetical protein
MLYLLYDVMITILFYVLIMEMSILLPFWRAISKSRRSANRVLSSQPRIYRLAFRSEDSQDALVNTAQWFTRDEPLQGFNTQREFPRGK